MKLFEELKTRNVSFKNRIVMPPMAIAKADEKGYITDDILDYYQEKTKDKLFSTVIVEHNFVEARGKASNNQVSIADDSCIDGLKKLSDLIKKNESTAVVQISHAGSSTNSNIIGESPVGPSRIKKQSQKQASLPRELNIEEIKEIEDSFAEAAFRAKEAGFDGVEIHSAHGYLLDQFLSAITNKRTDQYGGDINCRISIHL
ncbi:hypothetical protein [uncultured Anaerococcus sp.]|uniref:oxidoreductase n=1 Tax=uncultured Anaerococcus sp. TaxID=293428 RepID=UPI0028060C45|nr:hypothetical protein [uncultured Anaerococcus sp.]